MKVFSKLKGSHLVCFIVSKIAKNLGFLYISPHRIVSNRITYQMGNIITKLTTDITRNILASFIQHQSDYCHKALVLQKLTVKSALVRPKVHLNKCESRNGIIYWKVFMLYFHITLEDLPKISQSTADIFLKICIMKIHKIHQTNIFTIEMNGFADFAKKSNLKNHSLPNWVSHSLNFICLISRRCGDQGKVALKLKKVRWANAFTTEMFIFC